MGSEAEVVGGLHGGEAHMVGAAAVELAGGDDHARLLREHPGERPGIAVGCRGPQVEAAAGQVDRGAGGAHHVEADVEPLAVDRPLGGDMLLVVERGDRGGLHGPGDHQPTVLADLPEVVHDLDVARVEAGTAAGQVRPLRQAVEHDAAVVVRAPQAAAGLEDVEEGRQVRFAVGVRVIDRVSDARLGREVDHAIRPGLVDERRRSRRVGEIEQFSRDEVITRGAQGDASRDLEAASKWQGKNQVRAIVKLREPLPFSFHGVRGKADILIANETVGQIVKRFLVETFRFEL